MSHLFTITFRCGAKLFERLEKFVLERNIDRTSAIKLALHYYLNRASCSEEIPEQPCILDESAEDIGRRAFE